jgi:hypothetical protein
MAEVQAEGDGGTPLEPPDADDDKEKYVEMDPSERYGRVSLLLVNSLLLLSFKGVEVACRFMQIHQ